MQDLVLFPLIGRRQSEFGVRKLITARYAYIIYYIVDEAQQEIVILSMKHPAEEREYDDE